MAGRPPYKITDAICAQIEMLAAQGLNEKQICHVIGWSHTTFIKKKREYLKLMECLKRGQAKGIAKVTNSLFTNATNGDTTAQIWYLKNRASEDWKDRRENINDNTNKHSFSDELKQALLNDDYSADSETESD